MDPNRFLVTVCYIRDARDTVFTLDQLARQLGVDYVEVRERHSFDPSVWPALRRLVRERQIDIVHAHEYKTDFLALLLARFEGVAPLATAHGWTGHSSRERRFYYPADRWLLRRFPRVVAVSEQIRQTLIESGSRPDNVTTLLNGIDPGVFARHAGRGEGVRDSLGLARTATVIGSIGRLEPQKRFDLLIEAFEQLRQGLTPKGSDPGPLRLVIVGDGSQRAALESIVATRGLGHVVTLAGHRTDVVDVLHALDLFVLSSDYEGTPNAVLEAMAAETPVVATTAGGTAELMADRVHGLLVPPGRPDLLATAMAEALANPAASAERTRAARERIVRDLSFDARMRTLEGLYEQLMAQRPPSTRSATAHA
jgi:glycosyltransferase involved in cell wall biosynthesis